VIENIMSWIGFCYWKNITKLENSTFWTSEWSRRSRV